ncbi:MAG: TatD family hydrolase [Porphyromonadaceae bacterium]|nr:MAG: TatD family hydrolase [Porphyromonadaceae bacterium]
MIDSHSHIYCDAFDTDREEMLLRAHEAGVTHIVMPNENLESISRLKRSLRCTPPQFVSMTIGLHPEEIGDDYHEQLQAMHQMLVEGNMPFVAVGEIGIDLYWEQDKREEQLEALDTQLRWCKEFDLSFIIHCRDGVAECLKVMDNFGEPLPKGVFHSFTGTPADIEAIRKRGDFYFGVNGIVTFKKSEVKANLPVIGLDRLLLETDAPYLAPVPKRGKRNESAFTAHVCNFVAAEMGVSPAEIDEITTRNAFELFRLNNNL